MLFPSRSNKNTLSARAANRSQTPQSLKNRPHSIVFRCKSLKVKITMTEKVRHATSITLKRLFPGRENQPIFEKESRHFRPHDNNDRKSPPRHVYRVKTLVFRSQSKKNYAQNASKNQPPILTMTEKVRHATSITLKRLFLGQKRHFCNNDDRKSPPRYVYRAKTLVSGS